MSKLTNTYSRSGSIQLMYTPFFIVLMIGLSYFISSLIIQNYKIGISVFFISVSMSVWMTFSVRNPKLIFLSAIFYSFVWSMFARYAFAYFGFHIQWGLAVDIILVLNVAYIFITNKNKENTQLLLNPYFFMILVWVIYIGLQYLNPNALSLDPYFYALRPYIVYLLGTFICTILMFNQKKDLILFFNFIIIMGVISAVYGYYQKNYMSFADKIHLAPRILRHMLWGQLRVFSIYENAGQAGVVQGYAAVVSFIYGLTRKSIKLRVLYAITTLICLYGMALSGTRGAISVPIIGLGAYIFLSKNLKVSLLGTLGLLFAIWFLLFTNHLQGNYTIRRLRTAFDVTDASFQVRMQDQAKHADYLKKHTFGWGIGTSGYWGMRFLGDKCVVEATDSGYVQIKAETGIVGLVLFLALYLIIVFHSIFKAYFYGKKENLPYVLAITSSILGILVANYGNPVVYEFPTVVVLGVFIAFLWIINTYWNNDQEADEYVNNMRQ